MRTFLVVLLSFQFLMGQDLSIDPPKNTWQKFTYDLGSIFGGMGYSYSRPLHWKGRQWATAGQIAGGTALIYLVDDPISDYFTGIKDDVPKFIRDYGWEIGSPENNFMLTGGVYLTGLIIKDEKLRRTGVLLVSSAASAGLLQQVLKSLIGRARPLSGLSKDTFNPLWSGDSRFHSFPSGHAILAFTNAYAIAKQFKNPWVKGSIYVVGLVPGISRIWEGKHWLSDVFFSVAVSIFTVESIDRYLDKRYDEKYNANAKNISWDLNLGPQTVGVRIRF